MNQEVCQKEDIFDNKPQFFNSTCHKSESYISAAEKSSRFDRSTPISGGKEFNEGHVKFEIAEEIKPSPKPNKISSRSLMTPKLSKEDVSKLCEDMKSEVNCFARLSDSSKIDEEDKGILLVYLYLILIQPCRRLKLKYAFWVKE